MINLFINFYTDSDTKRQQELEQCLHNNIYNQYIDNIYAIIQNKSDIYNKCDSTKIKYIFKKSRPTYSTFFNFINSITTEDDINILANTDICFDDTLKYVEAINKSDCYCLSRWEYSITKSTRVVLNDSQDVWIFRGKIKNIEARFTLGIPGCDNKIAYLLSTTGYNVSNPCKTIIAIHMHESQIIHYVDIDKLSPPYKFVSASKLIC